ncbi:MAG: hypothetical protein HN909_02950 [Phycisphaerales bacterium]|jgi:Ca2+-binding EF-hand superfamily protein|nr:hypothetical protein [Phycisphaerales bacterium]MBT7170710.1 hypothetical protein [Phycisphaerales bacterium]
MTRTMIRTMMRMMMRMMGVAGFCVCVSTVALAATDTMPATPEKKPVAKPAVVKKPAGVDYCKGILLPNLTVMRAQFFAAAGKDSELTAKELSAANAKAPFQPIDSWGNLSKFDKSKNGQIDWFEFRAFREDVRKKLIKQFDVSKNVRLEDGERTKANALLAAGKLPGVEKKSSGWFGRGESDEDRAKREAERERRRAEFMKTHDTDGDGKLSAAEREVMRDKMRDKWRKDLVTKYDTDQDGVISPEERAKAEEAGGEKVRWGFWMQDVETKCFDDDGDGVISKTERATAKAFGKKMASLGEEMKALSHDADGDGKVSSEEARTARIESAQMMMRMMSNAQTFADYDGDGTASMAEMRQFQLSISGGIRLWMDSEINRYDTNGDGKISAKERTSMATEIRKEWLARVKKYDANSDGRTEPKEWEPLLYDLGREMKILPQERK